MSKDNNTLLLVGAGLAAIYLLKKKSATPITTLSPGTGVNLLPVTTSSGAGGATNIVTQGSNLLTNITKLFGGSKTSTPVITAPVATPVSPVNDTPVYTPVYTPPETTDPYNGYDQEDQYEQQYQDEQSGEDISTGDDYFGGGDDMAGLKDCGEV